MAREERGDGGEGGGGVSLDIIYYVVFKFIGLN